MKMDKTKTWQFLGISYFSGIVYYKNIHTNIIHAETEEIRNELLDTVVD